MHLNRKAVLWRVFFLAILCLTAVAFISCDGDDDDEGTIQIVNDDNHEYDVELYRASDDVLVDHLTVQEWPDIGRVDYFENIEEDTYYLLIRRRGDTEIRAYSRTFELDGGDTDCFTITTTAEIEDC